MAASSQQTEELQDIQKASDPPLLESLVLPVSSLGGSSASPTEQESFLQCLLCESTFDISNSRDEFLKHLVLNHKLVIADFKKIPDFERYIKHWGERFRDKPMTDFCSVIQTNSKESDIEPKELYYLLCDALPEDKELRLQLQKQRLQEVLSQQQKERYQTSFSHGCLFCREQFQGNRADIFNHMTEDHNFNVGHPDNLVYTTEFLDLLQKKLDNMQCLYCEKTFKDRHVLKEHMRKKQHKKINSNNNIYDKYYVINYLEIGKNWEEIQSEDDKELVENDSSRNDDWDDWDEDGGSQAVCLYCDSTAAAADMMEHMKEHHGFDLVTIKVSHGLNFYQQVKLVNYIRRQVHQGLCPGCGHKFDRRDDLQEHLTQTGHNQRLPDATLWDQPEYFFPTYENDNLLCELEDEDELEGDPLDTKALSDSNVIIAEDIPVPDSQAKQVISELLAFSS